MSARDTAARLIRSNGQPVTVTRRAAGTYDPASGLTVTPANQAGFGVVLPLSQMAKQRTNIMESDQQLLLAAPLAPVPKVDDFVTLADGSIASIVAVDPLSPAGTDLLYDCIIRIPQG